MLVGALPFDGYTNEDVIAAIKKGEIQHQNP
jgi:hypothetical protein